MTTSNFVVKTNVTLGDRSENVTLSTFPVYKAMEEKEQPTAGLHFVGKKDELIEAKRSFRTIEGRDILIVSHEGIFYALDSYCYRKYTSSTSKLNHASKSEMAIRLYSTILNKVLLRNADLY